MTVDIIAAMEKDERAMERMASAFEVIADTLTAWYKLEQQRFEKQFPVKPDARDATITRIPSREDALKEDQGASEEPTDEWIGLREQELIESENRSAPASRRKK